MAKRKLDPTYKESLYLEGYLDQQARAGSDPEYGYNENHLPETSGKARQMKTMLALVKEQ